MNEIKINDVLRKIKLESDLEQYLEMNLNEDELILLFFHNYSLEDALYLVRAYNMPIRFVSDDIKQYDNGKPYIDELMFLNELAMEYDTTIETIRKRIKEVRNINKINDNEKKLSRVK